jgi:hypothetical protein
MVLPGGNALVITTKRTSMPATTTLYNPQNLVNLDFGEEFKC